MAARAFALLVVSVAVGVVELFLGMKLGFIRSGDEGVWQKYVAAFSVGWGALVALLLWRKGRGALALGLGLAAAAITVATLLVTVFALLARSGAS